MQYVDYKAFIEEYFTLMSKEGEEIPFIFNETQNYAYSLLEEDYPDFKGIRENWLKYRQWGGSSFVVAMFTVDFILSESGDMPNTSSNVYSHKDKETRSHFDRMSHFYNCWLKKTYQTDDSRDIIMLRRQLLESDQYGEIIRGINGAEFETFTAGSKSSGRGGTKQNLLFTEIAFYPNTPVLNAKKIVTGASKQIKPGFGKIFRESSGNLSGDYWHKEYQMGKKPLARYKSRFFAWYLHKEYTLKAPTSWKPISYYDPILALGVTIDQCYWHYTTCVDPNNPTEFDLDELREYPTYDVEAFLLGGDPYFDKKAIEYYSKLVRKPLATDSELERAYGRI